MRHIALFVTALVAGEHYYVDLLGLSVEWRPDNNNVYLSSGNDNLTLHRASENLIAADRKNSIILVLLSKLLTTLINGLNFYRITMLR